MGVRATGDVEKIPLWHWIKKLGKKIEEIKKLHDIDNKLVGYITALYQNIKLI